MQLIERRALVGVILLLGLPLALVACGGGNGAMSAPPPSGNTSPSISSLSPTSVVAGGSDFTLTVNGSNFASPATVTWNGNAVATTFVNSQQVTATIPGALIASAEDIGIAVRTTLTSNIVQFAVNNPTPQITSLSPDNVMAGSPPVVLTVNGLGFEPTTYLLIGGNAQPPQSQTSTQLQVTIPSNELATATSITISAANLALTAGPSNQIVLTVTPFTSNPVPTLSSALNLSVPEGWPGFQLHVYGANFVAASVLQWNGMNRPTTVISSTELAGAISAGQLASSGAVQVAVSSPSPGGGVSGSLSVQIQSFSPDATGVVDRSDIGTDLTEPDGGSGFPAVSGNGRFVAFLSSADNLIPPNAQTEFYEDNLFLRDTCIGAPAGCVPSLTFISPAWDYTPAISADGRFVAFTSDAGILLYDSCAGAPAGCVPGIRIIDDSSNGQDGQVSLSADGRFAVFFSGDLNCGYWDVCDGAQPFLNDTCAGTSSSCTPSSQAISQSVQAYDESGLSLLTSAHPSISPDGRFIVFNSNTTDVNLYDSCQGAGASCSPSSAIVSVANDGGQPDGISFGAAVNIGGRYVVFLSSASNLTPGNVTPGTFRVYLRDMCSGAPSGCTPATTLIAVAGDSSYVVSDPSISADGRYIAFRSAAADLVPGDTNGADDVFVFDTCAGVSSGCSPSTVRVSVALDGAQGNGASLWPMISSDGRFVTFTSLAKLGPGASDGLGDIYLARH
jgi:trimeric autotransporter adhesin